MHIMYCQKCQSVNFKTAEEGRTLYFKCDECGEKFSFLHAGFLDTRVDKDSKMTVIENIKKAVKEL